MNNKAPEPNTLFLFQSALSKKFQNRRMNKGDNIKCVIGLS